MKGKIFTEKYLHAFFDAGILLKGIDGIGEVILGIFLYVDPSVVNNTIGGIFGDELTERPQDPFWHFLFHGWSGFSINDQHFWAFLFLAYGITKLFLVAGLLKKKLWTYPIAAFAFTCFGLYQIFHIIYFPSLLLGTLTVLDAIFIFLIIHEYRYQKNGGLI